MSEEIKDNMIEEEQGEGLELKVSTRSGKVESDICLEKKGSKWMHYYPQSTDKPLSENGQVFLE